MLLCKMCFDELKAIGGLFGEPSGFLFVVIRCYIILLLNVC